MSNDSALPNLHGTYAGEHFDFVDQAKALGILLVVITHAPGMPTWFGVGATLETAD